MRKWLQNRLREERGSVLPIVAVLMLAMIGIAAYAIDLSTFEGAHRDLQGAADAAALAGSQDLPSSASTATTDATSYVTKNITGATTTVTTPYNSDSNQIKVVVSKTYNTTFGGIFGVKNETITATAVAKHTATGAASSFFAADTNCGDNSITLNGSGWTVSGGIHSNGSFFLNGSSLNLGAITYGGPNTCSLTPNGSGNTYTATRDTKTETWPYDYSVNPPACTYSASSFSWNTSGITLPSGVYCATGAIDINGSNISGNVTFIADAFQFNGSGLNFTPYAQGLLAYQTGTQWLNINGSAINGASIFAPHAGVIINGSGGTESGFIEAQQITVNGSGFTFNGTGPPLGGAGGGALTQ
jgi:Flp pilus assembly protein TadG